MNLLVDTNVLVSAVIRDRLPQRVIDEIISRDDCFWIVTEDIEKEYRDVLARPKFKVADAIQQTWRAFVEDVTIRVEPLTPPAFPRDSKDEPFIAAALAWHSSVSFEDGFLTIRSLKEIQGFQEFNNWRELVCDNSETAKKLNYR